MFELSFIWAGLIAFAVLAYVVLDGFDLGVGILFPFFPAQHDRNVMMIEGRSEASERMPPVSG